MDSFFMVWIQLKFRKLYEFLKAFEKKRFITISPHFSSSVWWNWQSRRETAMCWVTRKWGISPTWTMDIDPASITWQHFMVRRGMIDQFCCANAVDHQSKYLVDATLCNETTKVIIVLTKFGFVSFSYGRIFFETIFGAFIACCKYADCLFIPGAWALSPLCRIK